MHDQFLSHDPNGAMVKQCGQKSAIDNFTGPHLKKATICTIYKTELKGSL
jgi:hypothetical protein